MNVTILEISANTSFSFGCNDFYAFYESYLEITFSSFSFFLNLACIAVFIRMIRSQKKNEDLFKYLLVKSFADSYLSISHSFLSIFGGIYSDNVGIRKFYFLQIITIIFEYYFLFSLQLVSIFCEIVSSFNRYKISINKFKFLDKISYKIVIAVMFVYSFAFYTYKFFSLQINETANNNSEVRYQLVQNELDGKMGYVHSFVRDGLCVLIIIVINVLTVIQLKKILMMKKTLIKDSKSQKIESAETRLTLMVLTMSTLTFCGHGLILLNYLQLVSFSENKCLSTFGQSIYWFTYQINFFLYYLFNLNFKKIVNFIFIKFYKLFFN